MNSSIDDDNDLAVKVPRRFYFDHLDLDEGAAERAAAEEAARRAAEEAATPPPPTFSEEELEAARQDGFAKGRQQGQQDALTGIEEAAKRTLEAIAAKLDTLLTSEAQRMQDSQDQAVQLATGIVRKLMPGLVADGGLGEVEHAIRTALVNHMEEQRLVIRAPTALMDALKERIDPLGEKMGYAGKLILLADDSLGASDCRVEWADGGAERNMDALLTRIERATHRALAGQTSDDGPESEPESEPEVAPEITAKEATPVADAPEPENTTSDAQASDSTEPDGTTPNSGEDR